MEALISEILLLAELGEQKDLEREVFNVADLAKGFIDDLQALEPGRVISTKFLNPLMITGSQRLMAQLFSNLFSNARRYTEERDRVEIEIEKSNDCCIIRYNDAGPGLPDQFLANGAVEFSRFDRSRSRESGGSGLGLSIVTAIVKAHSGEITFGKSELGGLKIVAKLPQ
jgi:signal transduction histidine kinase